MEDGFVRGGLGHEHRHVAADCRESRQWLE
jgi:hypothetical protein